MNVPSPLESLAAAADVLQHQCFDGGVAVIAVGAVVVVVVAVAVAVAGAAAGVVVGEQLVEWMLAAAMVVNSVGAGSWEKVVLVNAEAVDAAGAEEQPSEGQAEVVAAAQPLWLELEYLSVEESSAQ